MVSTEGITDYTSNMSSLGMEQVEGLKALAESHPWCAAYKILLTKCYKNAGASQFDSQVQIASLYAGDRELLYELLHKSYEIEPAAEIVATENVADDVAEPFDEQALEQDVPVDQPLATTKPPVNEEPELVEESEVSEEKTPESIEIAEIKFKGFHIEGQITEEDKVNFEEIVQYDPTVELHPIEKVVEEKIEIPFDKVVYNPEVELKKLATEKDEDESADHDFMYWLNHVGDDEAETEAEAKEEHIESPRSVEQVSDLLEKFLESKKRLPRLKREFFDPETSAEKSELEDSEVVTETLAKIYIKQELFEKAIEVYRKLSLQNPEKSATFAALIKELEEKIN